MPQSGRGHSRPRTIYVRVRVHVYEYIAQRDPTSACTRTMAMGFFREECGHKAKLHACVLKSTIPACCSFCRTVAERLRQQWHDLASSYVAPDPKGLGTRLVSH